MSGSSSSAALRNPIAVALDTGDRRELEAWVHQLAPVVGVLKVGLEAFVRWGPEVISWVAGSARSHQTRLFLDLKLHDIPNTVAGAVTSARELGVDYLTLHAGGGRRMIEAAAEAAGDEITLLAVTVLTHLEQTELDDLDLPGAAQLRVRRWAQLAQEAGAGGVVCSPQEVATLRAELDPRFVLVTPGVRPPGADAGDQRRVATPSEALQRGSDLLVIGRPITRSSDPARAVEAILDELAPGA